MASPALVNSAMIKLTWSTHPYIWGGDVVANVILNATQSEIDLSNKSLFPHDALLVAGMLPKCK